MNSPVLLFLITLPLLAKDKPPHAYPERGQIVGIASHSEAYGGGVSTDAEGGVHSNPVKHYKIYVWTLLTPSVEYQIESTSPVRPIWMKPAKGAGELADEVAFRIEKQMVYIQYGEKERRYRIVGKRLLDPHLTNLKQ
jgi:hypothetical protein